MSASDQPVTVSRVSGVLRPVPRWSSSSTRCVLVACPSQPRTETRARRLAARAALEEQQPRQVVVLVVDGDHLAREHLDRAAVVRRLMVERHLHRVVGEHVPGDPRGDHAPSVARSILGARQGVPPGPARGSGQRPGSYGVCRDAGRPHPPARPPGAERPPGVCLLARTRAWRHPSGGKTAHAPPYRNAWAAGAGFPPHPASARRGGTDGHGGTGRAVHGLGSVDGSPPASHERPRRASTRFGIRGDELRVSDAAASLGCDRDEHARGPARRPASGRPGSTASAPRPTRASAWPTSGPSSPGSAPRSP